jgi:hypothetical protein
MRETSLGVAKVCLRLLLDPFRLFFSTQQQTSKVSYEDEFNSTFTPFNSTAKHIAQKRDSQKNIREITSR